VNARALALLALACVVSIAMPAPAEVSPQERVAARALADAGFELFTAGDYETALDRFASAEKIIHAPPHLLFMARCYERLGRLLEARAVYLGIVEEPLDDRAPREFHQAKDAAARELAELLRRIPAVRLEVLGPDPALVELSVDGATHPFAADQPLFFEPGSHRFEVRAAGYLPRTRSLELREGRTELVRIALQPVGGGQALETSPSLLGPAVLLSLGGAGLIVGAVTGGLALGKAGELEEACPRRSECPAAHEPLEEEARRLGTASTVAFAVGGAMAGAGAIWLIVALSEDDQQELAVAPRPGGAALRCRF
jgi:hypothetical protein